MKRVTELFGEIRKLQQEESALARELQDILGSKPMRIKCERFNGQPYGRSAKLLKGKIISKWAVSVQCDEVWCQPLDPWMPAGLPFTDLEIVKEKPNE